MVRAARRHRRLLRAGAEFRGGAAASAQSWRAGAYVEIDGVTHPAPAPRFSATPAEVGSPPAGVGTQTRELLEMAGYGAAEVEALRASGIV